MRLFEFREVSYLRNGCTCELRIKIEYGAKQMFAFSVHQWLHSTNGNLSKKHQTKLSHTQNPPEIQAFSPSFSSSSHHSRKESDCDQHPIFTLRLLLCDGDFVPNRFTFPSLFKACRKLSAIEEGRQIHVLAIKKGFQDDVFVQRALVRMYAKCGGCGDAWKMFVRCYEPDVVSQNDLITGYVRNGQLELARKVFDEMADRNSVSWSVMIDGYCKSGRMDMAQCLFDEMPERNQFPWNSLLSGYLKCGRVEVAREIFDRMPKRDVFAWTVMISGYSQNSQFKESLKVFLQMQKSSVVPNRISLISVLPAIAQLGALSQGRWIHAYVDKTGIKVDGVLGAALVDMYCKCGCIGEALALFENLNHKELSAWNSIILGLATHGLGTDALCIFSRMQRDSAITPNEITFIGVLSACCHAGLVNEGRKMFKLFTNFYKLLPNIRHYGCMVDLLGRAGLLDEAKEVIEQMPIKPNPVIWKTLLGACRTHKNIELADHIARVALESGPQDSGFYALLSNIFAEAGRWNDMGKVRREMNDLEVQKVAGCSWVEVDGVVHEFFVGGERFHTCWREIKSMLDKMERLIMLEKLGTYI